jgi:hypothetical protein
VMRNGPIALESIYVPQTGDLVALLRLQPSWSHRGIERCTGARHHHDETIRVQDGSAAAWVLYTRPPCPVYISWEDRLDEALTGKISMAVFRPTEWCEGRLNVPVAKDWRDWQRKMEMGQDLIAELELPYDVRGIWRQGRNWLRDKLSFRPLRDVAEYKIHCTDGCERLSRLAGRSFFRGLSKQPYWSPIHVEKAWSLGGLTMVANWGLLEKWGRG